MGSEVIVQTEESTPVALPATPPREPNSASRHKEFEAVGSKLLRLQLIAIIYEEALQKIAAGEGFYGAQAAEYKAIAREALNLVEAATPR